MTSRSSTPSPGVAHAADDHAADDGIAEATTLARTHHENFPVLAPFLGSRRDELALVYAFCRTTDDLGDELPGDRLAALDGWESMIRRALAGDPPADPPIMAPLAELARRRALPESLFLRLLEANRRDQRVHRYPDQAALLEYCEHSATPVGRMVLGVIGSGGDHAELADATCIGLQLANFWQDVRRDWAQGRCYLPLDRCRHHGVDPELELGRDSASPPLRALLAERVEDARSWLERGWPLADHLPVRWRALVRAFSRGGWAVCDALEAGGFDPLRSRPEISRRTRRWILLHELARSPRKGVALGRR
ncbi:MAG TPA: squalene/phytoene synthase family protein [Gemmatimonadota bacterium]|nr:squalene/phytoene synthase family protein [Gemmatimonadota bacterium]